MKIILICFISLWMLACSTVSKTASSSQDRRISIQYSTTFRRALNALESQQFSLAVQGFKSILKDDIPSGPFKWSVLFNLGSSYLSNKKCPQAKTTFQDLLSQTNSKYKFRGASLFQLHYTHECLGEIHQALSVLESAEKQDPSRQQVEVPSRYSILYSFLKNKRKALMYQSRALTGLKIIKRPIKDKSILDKVAAKNFYIMGRSFSIPQHMNLDQFLNALPYHQIYLTQAILIPDPTWAPIAEKEMIDIYKKTFSSYKKIPFNKKSLYKSRLMKAINQLSKIARQSHSKRLQKISSEIIKKSRRIK